MIGINPALAIAATRSSYHFIRQTVQRTGLNDIERLNYDHERGWHNALAVLSLELARRTDRLCA